MKLNIPNSFDTGMLREAFTKAGVDGTDDFISYIQSFSSQMVTAFRGGITVEENMNSDVRVVELQHDTSLTIQLPDALLKKTPKHILITKAIPFANSVTAFNWQITQNGLIEVKASFAGTPTSKVQVTMVILF